MNKNMTQLEAAKLQMFLQAKLNPELVVQCRNRPDECAEIHIADECLGVVSKIIDEGETSYSFEITILDIARTLPLVEGGNPYPCDHRALGVLTYAMPIEIVRGGTCLRRTNQWMMINGA